MGDAATAVLAAEVTAGLEAAFVVQRVRAVDDVDALDVVGSEVPLEDPPASAQAHMVDSGSSL